MFWLVFQVEDYTFELNLQPTLKKNIYRNGQNGYNRREYLPIVEDECQQQNFGLCPIEFSVWWNRPKTDRCHSKDIRKTIRHYQIVIIDASPLAQINQILLLFYFRFAASVRRSCNNDDLLDHSNFDEHRIPCLAELYKYRIVISTLTVSGRLLQAKMDSNHFTHLFIDECESAAEAFTLLPIALCSSMKKINAHVVLSGDPHQLGPVVRHTMAKQMTMGKWA